MLDKNLTRVKKCYEKYIFKKKNRFHYDYHIMHMDFAITYGRQK